MNSVTLSFINENFVRMRRLGAGGFGTVYLVQNKDDRCFWVLKEISLDDLDERARRDALNEVEMMKRLKKHPCIIELRDCFNVVGPPVGHLGKPSRQLMIVMAYADGGDLAQAIQRRAEQKKPFPEAQIVDWFVQICLALKHMHDRKLLHRDLKAANVFLTSKNMVKLGDFGISRALEHTMQKARTQIGTPLSLSPEICEDKPYSAPSDIWALGVVLYHVMALKHPFTASNIKQLITKIVQADYPSPPVHYTAELRHLVSSLLQKNPAKRPTINQLLSHPYIRQHISKFLNENQAEEEFSHTIIHKQKMSPKIAASPHIMKHGQRQTQEQQQATCSIARSKPAHVPAGDDEYARKRLNGIRQQRQELEKHAVASRAKRWVLPPRQSSAIAKVNGNRVVNRNYNDNKVAEPGSLIPSNVHEQVSSKESLGAQHRIDRKQHKHSERQSPPSLHQQLRQQPERKKQIDNDHGRNSELARIKQARIENFKEQQAIAQHAKQRAFDDLHGASPIFQKQPLVRHHQSVADKPRPTQSLVKPAPHAGKWTHDLPHQEDIAPTVRRPFEGPLGAYTTTAGSEQFGNFYANASDHNECKIEEEQKPLSQAPDNQGIKKTPSYEEQLALARKQYFEERILTEERLKQQQRKEISVAEQVCDAKAPSQLVISPETQSSHEKKSSVDKEAALAEARRQAFEERKRLLQKAQAYNKNEALLIVEGPVASARKPARSLSRKTAKQSQGSKAHQPYQQDHQPSKKLPQCIPTAENSLRTDFAESCDLNSQELVLFVSEMYEAAKKDASVLLPVQQELDNEEKAAEDMINMLESMRSILHVQSSKTDEPSRQHNGVPLSDDLSTTASMTVS